MGLDTIYVLWLGRWQKWVDDGANMMEEAFQLEAVVRCLGQSDAKAQAIDGEQFVHYWILYICDACPRFFLQQENPFSNAFLLS